MNKVILRGRIGQDIELSYTPSGKAVANFSLATTEGSGDKKTTEWHSIVAWEKQAELINQYLSKGSELLLEGKNKTRSWDDKKTGQKRYKTEVHITSMEFISNPNSDSSSYSNNEIPF